MKTIYKLDCSHQYDFMVLAICSHTKAYKLCWRLNKIKELNFEKTNYHTIGKELYFSRYKSVSSEGLTFNLLSNISPKGYILPNQKQANFFLVISLDFWRNEKHNFLTTLKTIKDILLVFEIDLTKEKHSDRFIIYD